MCFCTLSLGTQTSNSPTMMKRNGTKVTISMNEVPKLLKMALPGSKPTTKEATVSTA